MVSPPHFGHLRQALRNRHLGQAKHAPTFQVATARGLPARVRALSTGRDDVHGGMVAAMSARPVQLELLEGEALYRRVVLEKLRGTAGCTHLNDALRALAEVPQLVKLLERA